MGAINVYLKPFNPDGTYQNSYIDITKDVSEESISELSQQLDNSDFDVGVFSSDSITISLNNQSGAYSDVGVLSSLFYYRRAMSKVKIEWLFGESSPICGMAISGDPATATLGTATDVFEGFIEDKASPLNIDDQKISFTVLGKESIFGAVEAGYAAMSNSDDVSTTIYNALNVSGITDYLTIDIGNISPDLDFTIDDVTPFENSTAREVVDDLLAASNSVLTVVDDVVYVTDRTATPTSQYTFYGQASPRGNENIANIKNYRNGVNRMINFWTWQDTSLVSKNATTISRYGVSKKEISYDFVTNNTTRQSILDNLKNAYGTPKIEMDLYGLWDLDTITLSLLDKVVVDYPTNNVPFADEILPIIGTVKIGEFSIPYSEFSLTVDTTTNFKITGRRVSMKSQGVIFKLREI